MKVLEYWFVELGPSDWFSVDVQRDSDIAGRFGELYENIRVHYTRDIDDPEVALVQIIVLDQFSRNMFRGTARAFEADPLALDLAQNAVRLGLDRELESLRRQFIYMPYMHSEDKSVHAKAVSLFTELDNDHALKYELEHKAIIDRFGRYPHRNKILGRESTPEELEFLKTHKGF